MATNKSKNSNSKKSQGGSKKQTTPNYQKKAIKTVKKAAKKNPKAFIIIVIVLLLVIGAGAAVYFFFLKDRLNNGGTSSEEVVSSEVVPVDYNPTLSNSKGVSINFLQLGNWFTGDSTFIKINDLDVLIDAGSRQESSTTIAKFITDNHFCTDGKLEYVIATHAHRDHIAGFVGTADNPGIFDTYKIGTIIDFALTNQTMEDDLYNKYVTKMEAGLASGNIEHHYTALQCVEETGGAQKEYVLADGITMTILDQKFYKETSSKENNYSVCTLFTQNNNHYLFTGDLEKAGEVSLVAKNTLPHCQLFKGGHHGSKTSNNDELLSVIQPETVCICSCCGSPEFKANDLNTFPTQETINNIAKYTNRIYVTSLYNASLEEKYEALNGDICFKCEDGSTYTITGSNNSTILKETDWFKTNRTWPEDGK